LGLIERAILVSDIGINPQNDGTCIRLMFPPMTEERRRDLTKEIGRLAEECKVAIRSIRRDAIDKLKDMKKKAEITEDDLKNGEKKMQDLTDRFTKEADKLAEAKQKGIMEI
jgi:ribosome recycling factor